MGGSMESMTSRSPETGSVFVFGMKTSGTQLETSGLAKNAGRALGGDVLGGREMKRAGLTGMVGQLSVSNFFPNMQVESYQSEGRTILFGFAAGTSMEKGTIADPRDYARRGNIEQEEKKTFFESLTVGPKPSGGLFGF